MQGQTLRLSRLRLGLRQHDVAVAADCSRARVAQVEQMARVPADWASRYRAAVEQADATQSSRRSARVRLGARDGLNRPGGGEGGAA